MARNIVLISIDSLRADYCGASPQGNSSTPALDEMATNGVTYKNAIAPGHATPISMPAVFTGFHSPPEDIESHVHNREAIQRHMAAHPTIPESLSQLGYATAGVTPNPFTSRMFGFSQGFDRYEDFLERPDLLGQIRSRIVSRWARNRFVAGFRFGMNMIGLGDSSMPWESYYDTVLEYADEQSDPFFLWIFLLDPHWPYRPPRRHRNGRSTLEVYYQNWQASNLSDRTPTDSDSKALRDLYDGTVRYTDEFIARLRQDLAEYDPIYVIHADHGEAFGEHGQFGHGPNLYEENIHVPLMIGNVTDSRRISRPISLRKLPGILNALTIPGSIDWESFTTPWTTACTWQGDYVIRGQNWKYYVREDGDISFYDLDTDPSEQNPLNEVPEELRSHCEHLWARHQGDLTERMGIVQTARDLPAQNCV